jgi:capsular polysaccharide biosynthesis protein
MIDSRPVAEEALNRSGVPRAAGAVVAQTSVRNEAGTQLLEVRVTDTSPSVARDLANAVAHAFVDKVQQYEPGAPASVGDVPTLPAYVFQEAGLPVVPEPTALNRNLFIAAVFGFLAASGVVLLLDYLDVTVKSAGDAEARLELPVLGTIPLVRDLQASTSSALRERTAPAARSRV